MQYQYWFRLAFVKISNINMKTNAASYIQLIVPDDIQFVTPYLYMASSNEQFLTALNVTKVAQQTKDLQ